MKKRLQVGSLPSNIGEKDRNAVSCLFSMPLEWSYSVLEVFLSGVNGVVHVPTALLNLGWIETTNGDFYFYRQGMSPGVCSIIEAADRERLEVAAAYHCQVQSALDTYNMNYGARERTLREFAQNTGPHNKTKGVQRRFLSQDVPYWLVPCSELGALAGIPTPFIDMLILLASTFGCTDYSTTGRTLQSMGLGSASRHDIATAFGGTYEVTLGRNSLVRMARKRQLLRLPWFYRGLLS